MLTLDRVSKRYGSFEVLREVTLEIPSGERLTVTGDNGSGKTTLLRLLCGAAAPTRGVVRGIPRPASYLPEKFSPPPLMRSPVYLAHLGRLQGLSRRQSRDRADELCRRLNLQAGRPFPYQLSKGNVQKIGLAQAFAAGAALIVLDEPRTGLDTDTMTVLDELIDEAVRTGSTVISSEHDPASTSRGPSLRLAEGEVAIVAAVSDPLNTSWCRVSLSRPAGWAPDPDPAALGFSRHELGAAGGRQLLLGDVPVSHREGLLSAAIRDGWEVDEVARPHGPA